MTRHYDSSLLLLHHHLSPLASADAAPSVPQRDLHCANHRQVPLAQGWYVLIGALSAKLNFIYFNYLTSGRRCRSMRRCGRRVRPLRRHFGLESRAYVSPRIAPCRPVRAAGWDRLVPVRPETAFPPLFSRLTERVLRLFWPHHRLQAGICSTGSSPTSPSPVSRRDWWPRSYRPRRSACPRPSSPRRRTTSSSSKRRWWYVTCAFFLLFLA